MRRSPKHYLHDAREAALAIASLVAGKSLQDYEDDFQLRSTVERQFIIIGEAFYQLEHAAREVLDSFPDHREIIRFRHMLVHHYDRIDNETVWGIVQDNLEPLIERLNALLE